MVETQETSSAEASWIAGGGEMGSLIRAFDWSKTAIGPMKDWSPTLRVMIPFLLANRFPLLLWWGPEYVSIYNDAYRPVLGTKHPWALGKPVSECWSEIWHILKPLIDTPFNGGPATWNEDIELEINRHGFLEETHFTVAYSAVPDEAAPNGTGGVLATVVEITEKVVAERRTIILRDLAARAGDARSTAEACAMVTETLALHPRDVPFALLYLIGSDRKTASLAGAAGIDPGTFASPNVVALSGNDPGGGWHFSDKAPFTVFEDLQSRFPSEPEGSFSSLTRKAVVLPIAALNSLETSGFLVVGTNPRLELDERHTDFLQLVKAQVRSAIANARSYEEERKRAEALAEIDRAKTTFFSNVSHEFRTPLTLMLGHVEDMLSRGTLPTDDRERLVVAHRNSLRMLKLVNTLLEFSRIEAGRVRASFEPTDLAAATAELASVFRSATEKAGLKLIVDTPALPEPAYIDRQMWEKIGLNLLSNAFKYTLQGEIEVKLRADGDHFVLMVRDTGIGIPAGEMPRLFERFHRIEGAEGRTREGSGIGLALVQELVRLHGGNVSTESKLGGGTTFRISIPRGSGHLPTDQIGRAAGPATTPVAAAPFIAEALRWLPDGNSDVPEFELESPAALRSEERACVLVVDDNADLRDYLRRLLGPHYRLEVVADGNAALAAVACQKPDLVLTDVMLPGLDGLQLLKKLRSDPQTSTTPVIMLSARAGEESRIEGLSTGADDYLIKPFSARELLARIEAHLNMARYRAQAAKALQASEERFRAFVTASSDSIYRMGPDWREMRFLEGKDFIADTNGPSESWLSRYIHAEDQPTVRAVIRDAIASKKVFDLEHRVIRVDGSLGWAHSRAIPLLGADGEIIEWFGAARDVTERKHAEETQKLLMNELNHRVKNMLTTVDAIAQQTLRRSKDPASFADSFSGRLQSMSRMHSLLTSTNWEGADLREVIRDQIPPGALDDNRATASGPSVQLEPQMALHTALMLHELGTNSVKYGALSRADGKVSIEWSVSGDGLQLDWRERGGPPIKVPVRRGFGTTLIEQTVKGEGGSARRSIEGDGIHWELILPLANSDVSKLQPRPPKVSSGFVPPPAASPLANLKGKTFAIIEDEPLIALNIIAALDQAGARVAGQAVTVNEALRLIAEHNFDCALVDANLRGQQVDEVAAALTRKKVPFAFVTGYGREALPSSFARAKVLKKPFTEQQLLQLTAELLAAPPTTVVRLRD
ncbi:response regulator [Bradyrhizobium jicamae]|uniref:Blue-light-activated histidine kinase n=1 Tax=Bradyrhizobium jicamae TaxID=280332 RepID=A0ABS5FVH4_9BRAD|nr:response regulator [Bradyrhizobium jicamae]MBR0800841.1 response regulator [Bradyrhizobium jicamae]